MIRFRTTLAALGAALILVPSARSAIPFPAQPRDTSGIEKMRRGDATPADGKNKDAIADLSKYLTYRLVHPPFNGEPATMRTNENLETLLQDAERYFTPGNPRMSPEQQERYYAFAKEFGDEVGKDLLYVMGETVKKLEKVNAARMLALAGKLPCESLADVYLKIIREDKYPREIKLFAYQGLRNLLAHADPRDPSRHFLKDVVKKDPKNKEAPPQVSSKVAEIYRELEKVITAPYPTNITPDEVLVTQFIRREAVRAMAQFKQCVLRNHRKEVMGRPVWTLLRVARNDPAIVGTVGFHAAERVEALIGICSMRPDDKVNLEALAYLVNETLYEMAEWHAAEKAQAQKNPRNKSLLAWRITAMRLAEAMKHWKENTQKMRTPKVVSDLADQALSKMLNKMEAEGINAVPDNRPFADWRRDRKPQVPQVLTDDDSTKFGI